MAIEVPAGPGQSTPAWAVCCSVMSHLVSKDGEFLISTGPCGLRVWAVMSLHMIKIDMPTMPGRPWGLTVKERSAWEPGDTVATAAMGQSQPVCPGKPYSLPQPQGSHSPFTHAVPVPWWAAPWDRLLDAPQSTYQSPKMDSALQGRSPTHQKPS